MAELKKMGKNISTTEEIAQARLHTHTRMHPRAQRALLTHNAHTLP